ncbi:MAG: hypothetical protein RBT43_06335 [bacterium]|jgi:hypothetical protein|nr:hypothetical protein [bacterium]
MAKPTGFAAKTANREKTGKNCSVCGQPVSYIKHYQTVKNGGGIKYKQKVVGVCGCNKKEYFE